MRSHSGLFGAASQIRTGGDRLAAASGFIKMRYAHEVASSGLAK
jgi:hypothetical protein